MRLSKGLTLKLILYTLLVIYFGLFFAQKINLTTADLGRHIKNGEVILSNLKPIRDNHYSYIEQNFPTIMHHWGTGVIYFLVWKVFNFTGLSVLHFFINGLAVLFFYLAARRKSNLSLALFVTVLTVPIISTRVEVRPEAFSFLFLGLFLYLLEKYRTDGIEYKRFLPIMLVLQFLWVNTHIFFAFGFFLVGVYFVNEILFGTDRSRIKEYIKLLNLMIVVGLINPFGLKGLLEPLNIFKEYGYMIAENQSVLFMQKRFPQPMYIHFEVSFVVAVVLGIVLFAKKRIGKVLISFVLALSFGLLAWEYNRAIPLFGLFFVVFVSRAAYLLLEESFFSIAKESPLKKLYQLLVVASVAFMIFSAGFPSHYYSPVVARFGLGLIDGVQNSAEFFKGNNIQGPILNNYDIGSYLIFHLYPEHMVFVDNRPEAYSVEFFRKIYEPMLRDAEVWEQKEKEYGFNVIYFYRRDYTQWAQPFLIDRIRDPEWAPVYVDDFTLILLRKNEQNAEIIEKYELPQNAFVVT